RALGESGTRVRQWRAHASTAAALITSIEDDDIERGRGDRGRRRQDSRPDSAGRGADPRWRKCVEPLKPLAPRRRDTGGLAGSLSAAPEVWVWVWGILMVTGRSRRRATARRAARRR